MQLPHRGLDNPEALRAPAHYHGFVEESPGRAGRRPWRVSEPDSLREWQSRRRDEPPRWRSARFDIRVIAWGVPAITGTTSVQSDGAGETL